MNSTVSLWGERGCRWFLAGVWCYAAVPKLLAPLQFGRIISAYGLLPEKLVLVAAICLPLAEVAAAILLLLKKRAGLYLTGILLALFILVLIYGISLGLDIDCGCFGPDDPEHGAFTGLRAALIRDLLLYIPLAYSFRHFAGTTQLLGEKK